MASPTFRNSIDWTKKRAWIIFLIQPLALHVIVVLLTIAVVHWQAIQSGRSATPQAPTLWLPAMLLLFVVFVFVSRRTNYKLNVEDTGHIVIVMLLFYPLIPFYLWLETALHAKVVDLVFVFGIVPVFIRSFDVTMTVMLSAGCGRRPRDSTSASADGTAGHC